MNISFNVYALTDSTYLKYETQTKKIFIKTF